MTGLQLKASREQRQWNQQQLAEQLGVSQAYVSLLERGRRPLPPDLVDRLACCLDLPATALPLRAGKPLDSASATQAVGTLGYDGFAYLRDRQPANPAEVLLRALGADHLDARVVESLPWLVRTYANLDWDWVVSRAKQADLQNRLGFVVSVARGLAEAAREVQTTAVLRTLEARLENSRLQKQDAFGRSSMTNAEERWLQQHSSPEAKHWNMLSTLTARTPQP
ncbi:MAG: helix-turn-helix transcriptional regulator [Acidobacteriota bacterium]|nr:helix-turn-helix transcriptional regulator [Acidobacteriota bacterium]